MKRPLRLVFGFLLLSMILLGQGCGEKKSSVTEESVVPESKEKGFTLILVENATGNSLSCELSKGLRPDEDHVRWYNQTNGPVEITFTLEWPFLESHTAMKFTVEAKKHSPYYSLDPDKPKLAYPYTLNPNLVDPGGGHGEPTISVGD